MLYSFFEEDGALRLDAFRVQIDAAVAAGCAGVSILGLGTEASKLSVVEREDILETCASHLRQKLPLMVTVSGETPEAQISFARHAIDVGASWPVLQPPPVKCSEDDLSLFYSNVIREVDSPVGIQNASEFLDYGLGTRALAKLAQGHENLIAAKLECSAVGMQEASKATSGSLALYNGRCGLELTDNYRAGAAGIVPGIEIADRQAAIWQLLEQGANAEAEKAYAQIAPVISSIMQGIPHFITYGKTLAAIRLGLEPSFEREPGMAPTLFGLSLIDRFAAILGTLTNKGR